MLDNYFPTTAFNKCPLEGQDHFLQREEALVEARGEGQKGGLALILEGGALRLGGRVLSGEAQAHGLGCVALPLHTYQKYFF